MIYIATFHGDIVELPPLCDVTLNGLLFRISDHYGFGKKRSDLPMAHSIHHWGYDPDDDSIVTPDPEDDKIEVWEFEPATGEGRIVWGFFGWHWIMPEGLKEQGKMPGHERSLYEEAQE